MYIQNMKALGSLLITAHANIWALKTLDTLVYSVILHLIYIWKCYLISFTIIFPFFALKIYSNCMSNFDPKGLGPHRPSGLPLCPSCIYIS